MNTSTATTPPSAQQLRVQAHDAATALATAERRWASLGDDPRSFQQRATVADTISKLKQLVAEFPQLIAAAERREAALDRLREAANVAHEEGERRLQAVLDHLPTLDAIRNAFEACAHANMLAGIIEAHSATRAARPFNAMATLNRAMENLFRGVRTLLLTRAITPRVPTELQDAVETLRLER